MLRQPRFPPAQLRLEHAGSNTEALLEAAFAQLRVGLQGVELGLKMTPLSAINKAKQNLDWMLSQVPRKINRRPSGFARTFV